MNSVSLENGVAAFLGALLPEGTVIRAAASAETIEALEPCVRVALRDLEHEVDDLWIAETEISTHTPGVVEGADPAEHEALTEDVEMAFQSHQYALLAAYVMAEAGALLQGFYVIGTSGQMEFVEGQWVSSLRVRLGIEAAAREAGSFIVDPDLMWSVPLAVWTEADGALFDNRAGAEPMTCTLPVARGRMLQEIVGEAGLSAVEGWEIEEDLPELVLSVPVGSMVAAGWAGGERVV